jgi:hypothetical protein
LAGQIASNFKRLVAIGAKLDSIEISNANALGPTQDQYDADVGEATLDKINRPQELLILE